MAWGPDLLFLYNDAYAPLLGQKHGRALGERFCDLWAEVWSEVVPLIDRALSGKTVYFEDMPMTVVRRGYPERATFTFSHAPLIGDDGQVAGLFCTVMETTRRVAAERRAAFELTVSDALRPLSSAQEVIATASALPGGELHADRVVYAEMNQASGRFTVPRRLRAQPETAGAVLVAITGYGQQQDRNDAFAAGFQHHLVKPVDIGQLARFLDGVAVR